ncbi:hypothetical protein ABZ820_34165 [Streptomyces diacarni]|uniref:hypothetical protein n=1 Tax=Streptomyces diacarni TaxID=2800381 RepID=UPI0033E614DB
MPDEEQDPEELPSEPEEDHDESTEAAKQTPREIAAALESSSVLGKNLGGTAFREALLRATGPSPLAAAHARLLKPFAPGLAMRPFFGPGIFTAAEHLRKLTGDRHVLPSPLLGLDLRNLAPGFPLAASGALNVAKSLNGPWEKFSSQLEGLFPENWRGEKLDHVAMLQVMEDGIPLAWVPGADVIRALIAEDDRAARRAALEEHAPPSSRTAGTPSRQPAATTWPYMSAICATASTR